MSLALLPKKFSTDGSAAALSIKIFTICVFVRRDFSDSFLRAVVTYRRCIIALIGPMTKSPTPCSPCDAASASSFGSSAM
jgi:hypothetical protein